MKKGSRTRRRRRGKGGRKGIALVNKGSSGQGGKEGCGRRKHAHRHKLEREGENTYQHHLVMALAGRPVEGGVFGFVHGGDSGP